MMHKRQSCILVKEATLPFGLELVDVVVAEAGE